MTHGPDEREAFLKALETTPFIGHAARRAGIGRNTVYVWMREDRKFKEAVRKALQAGRDTLGEAAYAVVQEKIKERNFAAARFFLLHFRSLYGVRQDAEESENEAIQDVAPEAQKMERSALVNENGMLVMSKKIAAVLKEYGGDDLSAPEEPKQKRSVLVNENGYMTVSKQMAEYLKQFEHDDDTAPQEPKRERSAFEDENGNLIMSREAFECLVQQGDLTEDDLIGEVPDDPDAPERRNSAHPIPPHAVRVRQSSMKPELPDMPVQPERGTS